MEKDEQIILDDLTGLLNGLYGKAPIFVMDNHEEVYELTGIEEVIDGAIYIGYRYTGG